MPTAAEHRDKHADNRALLDANGGLETSNECWAAVVAFYAALHLIELLAAAQNLHHRRHTGRGSRQRYLASHPQHTVVLSDYTALETASHVARYDSLPAFRAAFPAGVVRQQLIDGCLVRIEQYAAQFGAAAVGS